MKRKGLWIVLIILAILLVGAYAGGSWFFSSVAIASPTQTLADGQARADSFAELGLPEPEEISIDVGEVTLAGFLFENPMDGDCGAILLHGFTGTRYGALQYAPLFWERGCDLLAYDHRGHGASTPALHTFGYYEKEDLVERAGLVHQRAPVWIAPMSAVVGVSYGASTALQAAPLMPDVAFVLADSAYQDLASILRYPGRAAVWHARPSCSCRGRCRLPNGAPSGEVDDISAQNAIAEAQMPILLVHSLQDEYTPPSHSESHLRPQRPGAGQSWNSTIGAHPMPAIS